MMTRSLAPTARSVANAPVARTRDPHHVNDGFVSRTLDSRVSIPISRQLARMRITPNQVSVSS